MKTYMSIMISSDGSLASEITDILTDLGFKTHFGSHDFVYDWKDQQVTISDVQKFIDEVQNELRGMDVKFNITSEK